jgi:hypothetical protein
MEGVSERVRLTEEEHQSRWQIKFPFGGVFGFSKKLQPPEPLLSIEIMLLIRK